jgi:ribose transport system ATP-binding protein
MTNTARHQREVPTLQSPTVQVRGLSKSFPGTKALSEVDLDIATGEIHSLVGGNGSGKSTLIKILCGIYQGDEGGSVRVGDIECAADRTTPEFAREAGIHAVHQDLGVFLDMSVTENLALGHLYPTRARTQIDWKFLRARASELIERFEINALPGTKLRDLGQATRTQVAIARALQAQNEGAGGLLILDEPTASLPVHEVELLLDMLRRYATQGQSILYISHRLDEVLSLSNRISILRDGRRAETLENRDLDQDGLIERMIGRPIGEVLLQMPEVTDARPMLEVRGLRAGPLQDVSLSVARGEVLGIAGLLGSGRTELLRAVFGDLRIDSGDIALGGTPIRLSNPSDAKAAGIAFVPEDRAGEAAFADLSVGANMASATVGEYWSWRRPWIASRRMQRDAKALMTEFSVKAASDGSLLSSLSGGNQQKVVLARWLRRKPRLLLLDEPTQGVDVGARAEIYGLIRAAVQEGASVVLVASDFEELALVTDRVIVMAEGRVVGELRPPHISADRLLQLATPSGTKENHVA